MMLWISLFVLLDVMLVLYFEYDVYGIAIPATVYDSTGTTLHVPDYLTFINDMQIKLNTYWMIQGVKGDVAYELHLKVPSKDNIWRYRHVKGPHYIPIQLLINLMIYPMYVSLIPFIYVYPPLFVSFDIIITTLVSMIHGVVDFIVSLIVFCYTFYMN